VDDEHSGGAKEESRKNGKQNDQDAKALALQLGLPEHT
jgi:hypothetical protein